MRTIKLTRDAVEEIQTLAMYGEPIGGRVVYLFIENSPYDWGSYSCGCCTCCGCMCDFDDEWDDGDYVELSMIRGYDDDEGESE